MCFLTDTAKSAKSLLKNECPGLVLLHLNGNTAQTLDFLETARNLEPPVPVIVLTRKPKLDDAVQTVKKGAYDFWTKPFAPERLTKTIELDREQQEEGPSRQSGAPGPEDPIISAGPGPVARSRPLPGRLPRATRPFSSRGKAGPAKSCLPATFTIKAAAKISLSLRSTVPPFPKPSWRANCSGMKKAPLPGRSGTGKVNSSWRIPERFCSMRLPRSLFISRQSCCGSSRKAKWTGWAANIPSRLT